MEFTNIKLEKGREVLKVEYLVVYNKNKTICKTVQALKNLLQADADISIVEDKITHQNYSANLIIKKDHEDKNPSQVTFTISCSCSNINDIEKFSDLLRSIRRSLCLIDKNIYVIWDDRSLYYSEKAYPLIFKVENLMRKLITKFMVSNVGLGWTSERVPIDVQESINTSNKDTNYLQNVDFSKLKNFLFSEKFPSDRDTLIEYLQNVEDLNSLDLEHIQNLLPESNWKRYFKPFVNCESDRLKKQWDELYDYRCKIAHNKNFTKDDFNKVQLLFNELEPILQEAMNSLEKIFIAENERDNIIDNIVYNQDLTSATFIEHYRKLSHIMYSIATKIEPNNHKLKPVSNPKTGYKGVRQVAEFLLGQEIINEKQYKDAKRLSVLRDNLLFPRDLVSSEEIVECHKLMQDLISELESK